MSSHTATTTHLLVALTLLELWRIFLTFLKTPSSCCMPAHTTRPESTPARSSGRK